MPQVDEVPARKRTKGAALGEGEAGGLTMAKSGLKDCAGIVTRGGDVGK